MSRSSSASSIGDKSEEEEKELDLSDNSVVTKYKSAAEITNYALKQVIGLCAPGKKVSELSAAGDEAIIGQASKVFKGKSVEKGVAFPTCVSVNSIVGNYSALADDKLELKDGDVVKIDLAAHIDGFIATAAHTVVLCSEETATGRSADAVQAATTALEAAIRLIRPGSKSSDVSATLQKVVEAYGCTLVEGVLSHQLKQFIIDGNKVVLNRPLPDLKAEDAQFEENEVYGIDILVSTGEGKARVTDERETTVFKRALDEVYRLKIQAARKVFGQINRNSPTMPFTVRSLEGRTGELRMGLGECINHGLLHPYPVLHEKAGEVVAQAKATVLLMPNGSDRITPAQPQTVKSEKHIEDEDVKKVLASSIKYKKKAKKNRKKPAAAAAAAPADENESAQTTA